MKVLYRGANILILDEPTGVLTPQESKELFVVLRDLVKAGKTIIFISHKLKEVLDISDRITVMRRGKVVGHLVTKDTNEEEIATAMVGREVLLRVDKKPAKPGAVTFRVENLTASSDRGVPALKGISFELRQGEILGIAGVEGNGQSELVEVLAGTRTATGGKVWLADKDVTAFDARTERHAGIAHIPEDRRGATSRRSSSPARWRASRRSSSPRSPREVWTSGRSSSSIAGSWPSATGGRRCSWCPPSWTRSARCRTESRCSTRARS